jgi:hypothetical protein
MEFLDMSKYAEVLRKAAEAGKAEQDRPLPTDEDDAPSGGYDAPSGGYTDVWGSSPQPQPQDPDYLYRVYLTRYGRRG